MAGIPISPPRTVGFRFRLSFFSILRDPRRCTTTRGANVVGGGTSDRGRKLKIRVGTRVRATPPDRELVHEGGKTQGWLENKYDGCISSWQSRPQRQKISIGGSQQFRVSFLFVPPHSLSLSWKQVDERLNGDGTGLIFGINDESLGFILLTIPILVFSAFYGAQKDEGIEAGGTDDDSGLSL